MFFQSVTNSLFQKCKKTLGIHSRTVRYELRVLVGFKRAHRGRPKVYTGPAAKVSWCDLVRNYNGLSAIGSFEQGITMVSLPTKVLWFDLARNYNGLSAICAFESGITMVSLPSKVSWCDLARNYNGLSAIASVHVRLSKELQWFRCRQKCNGAIEQGITMVAKTKYTFYLVRLTVRVFCWDICFY